MAEQQSDDDLANRCVVVLAGSVGLVFIAGILAGLLATWVV